MRITNLLTAAHTFVQTYISEPLAKQTCENVMKENVKAFASGGISGEECIDRIMESVIECLSPEDCDLTLTSKKKIQDFISIFCSLGVLRECQEEQGIHLVLKLKTALSKAVMEGWAHRLAADFHAIFTQPQATDRAMKGFQWTQRFCEGITFFSEFQTDPFLYAQDKLLKACIEQGRVLAEQRTKKRIIEAEKGLPSLNNTVKLNYHEVVYRMERCLKIGTLYLEHKLTELELQELLSSVFQLSKV